MISLHKFQEKNLNPNRDSNSDLLHKINVREVAINYFVDANCSNIQTNARIIYCCYGKADMKDYSIKILNVKCSEKSYIKI